MPDDIMDIVKRTDASTVTQHGLYIRQPTNDPSKTWGRGRVTLIGDSAHAFLPNGRVFKGAPLTFDPLHALFQVLLFSYTP